MKKSFTLALFSSLVLGCFAAETIYRGDSTDKKDVISERKLLPRRGTERSSLRASGQYGRQGSAESLPR